MACKRSLHLRRTPNTNLIIYLVLDLCRHWQHLIIYLVLDLCRHWHDKLPRKLYLQKVNCPRDNENNIMFAFLAMLRQLDEPSPKPRIAHPQTSMVAALLGCSSLRRLSSWSRAWTILVFLFLLYFFFICRRGPACWSMQPSFQISLIQRLETYLKGKSRKHCVDVLTCVKKKNQEEIKKE